MGVSAAFCRWNLDDSVDVLVSKSLMQELLSKLLVWRNLFLWAQAPQASLHHVLLSANDVDTTRQVLQSLTSLHILANQLSAHVIDINDAFESPH